MQNTIILHQKSKSNHNVTTYLSLFVVLFYIRNRNQTTTIRHSSSFVIRLFYIRNRNQTTTNFLSKCSKLLLFYIRNRNQTTTCSSFSFCESNYFTSEIEIKPQQKDPVGINAINYFTSEIEIKPQLTAHFLRLHRIILHQKSKSNHNI